MNEPVHNKLRIEYKKSNSFRVIHADGAYGGTSPRLQLFLAFYSERFPIPQVLTFETTEDGRPIREISTERESKEGIIRETEVAVILDVHAAKAFSVWLNEQVAELEKRRGQILWAQTSTEEVQQ